MNDTVFMLLQRITNLATERETPFIIQENPQRAAAKIESPHSPSFWPGLYLATIGNTSVVFDGYNLAELIDLYAELKAGLEAEDSRRSGYQTGWERAREIYATSSK